MSEICRTCLRPQRVAGEVHDEGRHCPDSPIEARGARDEVACCRIGIELRDAQLADAKALNDVGRLGLVKLRDFLDLLLSATKPEVAGG